MTDEPEPRVEFVYGTDGEREAQAVHERRQADDPDHDPGGCWCCCMDCDFDWYAVTGQKRPYFT